MSCTFARINFLFNSRKDKSEFKYILEFFWKKIWFLEYFKIFKLGGKIIIIVICQSQKYDELHLFLSLLLRKSGTTAAARTTATADAGILNKNVFMKH